LKFLEGVLIALRSLLANKLRSILTLIGVIIGVMTVIAVTSIIAGMNKYVSDEIRSMGSNTFIVSKWGMITSNEEFWEAVKRKNITLDDMKAIKEGCTVCEEVGANVETQTTVKYQSRYIDDTQISGATANSINIAYVKAAEGEGRYISKLEEEHSQPVAFVGWEIKDKLFPMIDPIGKEIKIEGKKFKIIGVAEKKGGFLGGASQDNFVDIPITTFFKDFGKHGYDIFYGGERSVDIAVKAADFESMEKAMDQTRLILRARRHVPYNKKDDFGMMTAETFMDFYRQFTSTAYLTMIGISSIALVVGGIVIMNIMLVSVTERTREIGIRKALGARRRDVLWQFLVESVTLALIGGMIGVLLGLGTGKIVSMSSPLPATADPFWIGIGLVLATSIGLVFGVYPAMKAARLDPIEALRYE
jgi:putative ABC transport system permease protein